MLHDADDKTIQLQLLMRHICIAFMQGQHVDTSPALSADPDSFSQSTPEPVVRTVQMEPQGKQLGGNQPQSHMISVMATIRRATMVPLTKYLAI